MSVACSVQHITWADFMSLSGTWHNSLRRIVWFLLPLMASKKRVLQAPWPRDPMKSSEFKMVSAYGIFLKIFISKNHIRCSYCCRLLEFNFWNQNKQTTFGLWDRCFFSKVGVDSFCCVRSVVAICPQCGLKKGSSYIDLDVASCCIYPRAQQQSAPGLLNFQFSTLTGWGRKIQHRGMSSHFSPDFGWWIFFFPTKQPKSMCRKPSPLDVAQKDVGTRIVVPKAWFWVSGDAEANGWTTERWYKAVVQRDVGTGFSGGMNRGYPWNAWNMPVPNSSDGL